MKPYIHPEEHEVLSGHFGPEAWSRSRLRLSSTHKISWRWYEVRSQQLSPGEVLFAAFDVHQQVLAEKFIAKEREESFRRLDQQAAELERAQQMKNQFLANMSHELRTPLTAILGLSEALEVGLYGECPPDQREAFHTINDCGKSLLGLVNDILDVTKLETQEIRFELEPLSISELARAVVRLHKKVAHSKRVSVEVSVDKESFLFSGDRKRLKQILAHLLGNAIKFTAEDTMVELVCTHPEGFLEVQVLDRGPGVSESDESSIFESFRQLDGGRTRSYGGVGLGLSLVKKLVDLMNGDLSVSRREVGGSNFRLRIPVQETKPEQAPDQALIKGSGLVLVVDDHKAASGFLCSALRSWGFTALPCYSLTELKAAPLKGVTLVLMGGMLSDGSGIDGIVWLREQEKSREIPIIFLTATEGSDLRRAGLRAGAHAYLEKPVKLSQLSQCISTILRLESKS